MNYEIKIENATETKGTIDLHRLTLIADSIRKVSEGALQIRLRGISLTKGRKKNIFKRCIKGFFNRNKRRQYDIMPGIGKI